MRKVNCILLVDDCEVDIWIGEKIIHTHKMCSSVVTAANGIQALKKLHEYYDLKKDLPEIVLMDLQMAIMNGFDLIIEIKKLPYYCPKKTKIVILTAGLDESELRTLWELGVTDILIKPLEKNELLSILEFG